MTGKDFVCFLRIEKEKLKHLGLRRGLCVSKDKEGFGGIFEIGLATMWVFSFF